MNESQDVSAESYNILACNPCRLFLVILVHTFGLQLSEALARAGPSTAKSFQELPSQPNVTPLSVHCTIT